MNGVADSEARAEIMLAVVARTAGARARALRQEATVPPRFAPANAGDGAVIQQARAGDVAAADKMKR